MLNNINKTNKKLFTLVTTSLLAVGFLPACNFSTTNSPNEKVPITATNPPLTSQSNSNPSQPNNTIPSQDNSNPSQPNNTIPSQDNSNPSQPNNTISSQINSNPSQPSSPVASQNTVSISDLAKPAVVQVSSGCSAEIPFTYEGYTKIYQVSTGGSGSGFFVNSDGYIVTNAHVVESIENPQKCREILGQDYINQIAQDFGVYPDELLSDPQILQEIENNFYYAEIQQIRDAILPNGDRLPFEIKAYGAPIGEDNGNDVAVIKVQIRNAPVLKLADSDHVQIQDEILAVGYPYLELGDLLSEKSQAEATFSKGQISSSKQLANGSNVLQFDANVTHGNSGGPVLNEKGEVIGITTFGPSNISSGIAFAVTSNTILEYIRGEAGTNNEQGPVDELYLEGLQLYNQGQYLQAIEKFETVKRLFPQHSEIDRLIQTTQENIIVAN